MEFQIVEYNNVRVVTTKQIADAYGTDTKILQRDFNRNKDRYVENKHYIVLSGDEKRDFVNRRQIDSGSSKAKLLYLWTERGALLLAKSINTDKAWEAYERLVDFYFQKKEENAQMQASSVRKFNMSNTVIPKNNNWFAKNQLRMKKLCDKANVPRSTLYHYILMNLGKEYDLDEATKLYEKENGCKPIYCLDIVCYFKELADAADAYLDSIWEKTMNN